MHITGLEQLLGVCEPCMPIINLSCMQGTARLGAPSGQHGSAAAHCAWGPHGAGAWCVAVGAAGVTLPTA